MNPEQQKIEPTTSGDSAHTTNQLAPKLVLAGLFLVGLISALVFFISPYLFHQDTIEIPLVVDNTLVQREIESIKSRMIDENNVYARAKHLFDLASMQLLYRSTEQDTQFDAVRNLEEAYLLVQGDKSEAGKQLVDKINLTRLIQFTSLIFPFENFDLTKYEAYINASAVDSVATPYVLALLYMIDFSDNYFYSDDDKAVKSVGVYLKAVALDYFSDALIDSYKESLVASLKTDLSRADSWKNVILPERPLVTNIMAEAYQSYASSVLDEHNGQVTREYESELASLIDQIDEVTSDPNQRATVKLSVLRTGVQIYENIGRDAYPLNEKAKLLSEVSQEAKIMFDIFFGTSPELVNLPKS